MQIKQTLVKMNKIQLLPADQMHKFWAAYLNMARYNLFMTLSHIGKTIGVFREKDIKDSNNKIIKYRDNEEGIPNMTILNDALQPEQENKATALFIHHFPFLKYLHTKETADDAPVASLPEMRIIVKNLAVSLHEYRNQYSHYRYIDNRDDYELARIYQNEFFCGNHLFNINVVSTRLIKERYSSVKNTVQKGMIDSDSLAFITDGKVKFTKKLDDNHRPVLDKNGHFVKAAEKNPSHFLYPYTNNNGRKRLSDMGLIQLTCLFLDKKYITEFLSQCRFLDAFSAKAESPRLSEQRIMLEVLSALRIRLPQKKLSINEGELQISLDILNELKKCPQELYDMLGPEDKSLFQTESTTGEPVLQTRLTDRFPQLALSWIDSTKAFNNIRFQVNSGFFRYVFNNDKKCIDGLGRPRILQEPLNGFARKQKLEARRLDKLDGVDNGLWQGYVIFNTEDHGAIQPDDLPHISNSRTRYLFDGDNIGMRFDEFIPEISKLTDNRYKVPSRQSDCIISKFELPALLFHLFVTRKHNGQDNATENLIKHTVASYRRLFTDIRDGILVPGEQSSIPDRYGIRYEDVPEKIREYLGNRQVSNKFKAYKASLIARLIEETQYKQNKLQEATEAAKSDDNMPGRRNYIRLMPGSYASFLAQDIVFMQEADAEDKLTGLNYNIMQSSLATFNRDVQGAKIEIARLLMKAGLISSTMGKGTHPFLWKVINDDKVVDCVTFYNIYLETRLDYLLGDIPDSATFLHPDKKKWAERDASFYRNLASRYLQRPVILPRRLFEDDIRDILLSIKAGNDKNPDNMHQAIKEAIKDGRCNTSYMIFEYVYDYLEDCQQQFYGIFKGDMDHKHAFGFHSSVLKNLTMAKRVLQELKNDRKNSHLSYASALSDAIKWAVEQTQAPVNVRGNRRKPQQQMDYETFKSVLKRKYNVYTDTEKKFRRYAVQDCVLYLTAMQTINSFLQIPDGIDAALGGMCGDTQSILEMPVNISTVSPFKSKGEGKVHLVQKGVKIKDYGDIFRLLRDGGRLERLLYLHSGEEISVDSIREELDIYDRKRADVFDDLLDYERKITTGLPDEELMDEKGRIDFKATLAADSVNTQICKDTLSKVRNAFGHNQYPWPQNDVSGSKEKFTLHNCEISGTAEIITQKVKDIVEATPEKK